MERKLAIKSNYKYGDLIRFKKMVALDSICESKIQIILNKTSFPAVLKYGKEEKRLKFDRTYKFRIDLDGSVKKQKEIDLIKELYEIKPSQLILLMEILFAKENQEIIEHEDGSLEYHFSFLQY